MFGSESQTERKPRSGNTDSPDNTEERRSFTVDVPEVWIRSIPIYANSEEEARERVENLNRAGIEMDETFEYSHTMQPENWTVKEEE